MKKIYVKTINPYFQAVWDKVKTFEHRLNDRDYNVGDIVYLQEFDAEKKYFSGREIKVKITFLLKSYPGLSDDYCTFSFEILEKVEMNEDLEGDL